MSAAVLSRQPAGVPTGGQFAPVSHPEPVLTLVADWERPLAPRVTEDDRILYTHHHCEQLAWALHETTGWPYAAVTDGYDANTGTHGWLHVGVCTPDGNVLDVEGVHAPDTVLDTYGESSEDEDGDAWLAITPDLAALSVLPGEKLDEFDDDARSRARRVAAALLAANPNAAIAS